MKCPGCQYISSDSRDLCPKCLLDIRPHKKVMGLPVSNPDASYDDLVAALQGGKKKKKVSKAHAELEPGESVFGGLKSLFQRAAPLPKEDRISSTKEKAEQEERHSKQEHNDTSVQADREIKALEGRKAPLPAKDSAKDIAAEISAAKELLTNEKQMADETPAPYESQTVERMPDTEQEKQAELPDGSDLTQPSNAENMDNNDQQPLLQTSTKNKVRPEKDLYFYKEQRAYHKQFKKKWFEFKKKVAEPYQLHLALYGKAIARTHNAIQENDSAIETSTSRHEQLPLDFSKKEVPIKNRPLYEHYFYDEIKKQQPGGFLHSLLKKNTQDNRQLFLSLYGTKTCKPHMNSSGSQEQESESTIPLHSESTQEQLLLDFTPLDQAVEIEQCSELHATEELSTSEDHSVEQALIADSNTTMDALSETVTVVEVDTNSPPEENNVVDASWNSINEIENDLQTAEEQLTDSIESTIAVEEARSEEPPTADEESTFAIDIITNKAATKAEETVPVSPIIKPEELEAYSQEHTDENFPTAPATDSNAEHNDDDDLAGIFSYIADAAEEAYSAGEAMVEEGVLPQQKSDHDTATDLKPSNIEPEQPQNVSFTENTESLDVITEQAPMMMGGMQVIGEAMPIEIDRDEIFTLFMEADLEVQKCIDSLEIVFSPAVNEDKVKIGLLFDLAMEYLQDPSSAENYVELETDTNNRVVDTAFLSETLTVTQEKIAAPKVSMRGSHAPTAVEESNTEEFERIPMDLPSPSQLWSTIFIDSLAVFLCSLFIFVAYIHNYDSHYWKVLLSDAPLSLANGIGLSILFIPSTILAVIVYCLVFFTCFRSTFGMDYSKLRVAHLQARELHSSEHLYRSIILAGSIIMGLWVPLCFERRTFHSIWTNSLLVRHADEADEDLLQTP